jgi:transposase
VRDVSLWSALLGVEKTVFEGLEYDQDEDLVVARVRPTRRVRGRCGLCRRPCPGYDGGEGRRRWRALDLGTVKVVLEADAPRVSCRQHGVVVAAVPWARHGAGHTYAFDDTVAWLAVRCSKTAVRELMRVAWRTVGSIITRVTADAMAGTDRFANLSRIGIDEISYKKGHRYLTIVVDHDTRRLIWAAPGRDKATLSKFFDALGQQRCAAITHVSADAADWIADVVAQRCPAATQCADPFHVVKWATEALDEVRRGTWNSARELARTEPGRGRGRPRADAPPRPGNDRATRLKNSRYALWKNPQNLTVKQTAKLGWIAKTDPRLYRAYLLKEGLRLVFVLKGEAGKEALDRWISWARRCRIPAFVALQRRIVKHRKTIDATLDHGLSNGLIESTNTKIRVLTRVAFGFTNPEALIALAMLALGGYCPPLPGRATAK